MSWETFKQNILRVANNPQSIDDIDIVAETYANEYDAAVKRGGDTINGVPIQRGNVQIMEQIFKSALQKGLSSTEPYDLVGEMGKGVVAYWTGATLDNNVIPEIPAIGAAENIGVVTNIVINPGTWAPVQITPSSVFQLTPEKRVEYEEALTTEITKYENEVITDTPEQLLPREESINKLTGLLEINEDYRIDIPYTAPIVTAGTRIVDDKGNVITTTTTTTPATTGTTSEGDAEGEEVDIGGTSAPVRPVFFVPRPPTPPGQYPPGEYVQSIPYFPAGAGVGDKAVIIALTDLKDKVVESPPGTDGGNPRITQIQSIAGAQGKAWCACAVATWWQEAGFVWNRDKDAPDYHPNRAYVPTWQSWAVKTGRWIEKRNNQNPNFIPKPGDAAVYGWAGKSGKKTPSEHIYDHIGLVVSASSPTDILGVDGNYSGGKVAYNKSNFEYIFGFVRI
jgi:hypothetical protein